MKQILLVILFLVLASVEAYTQYYWVGFTDKNDSPWSLSMPEAYLSDRAIQRRINQSIPIDSLDLPVNQSYIIQVIQLGAKFIHSSKWLNGITVQALSEDFAGQVHELPFVREVQMTKRASATKSAVNKFAEPEAPWKTLEIDTSMYGESAWQVAQLNGQFLHNQDFRGEGMHIAVLDAGFLHADRFPAFDSLWTNGLILGMKDFVFDGQDFFETHYHGMSVLSIMGGNVPGELIGTAPQASYWLIRTEDTGSEYLIEEDNWAAAAEFADSAGVDIINSSLGYFIFDDPVMNHTYADMDGNTTRVTRAANIAVSRGMMVFSSAGNEGREGNSWKYIIAPSDGDSVIGVGATNKEGVPAPFTSHGPAYGGAVKPNISAVGWNTVLQRSNGVVGAGNGTSYSSPVMAGTAACLWQANPHATASQVKQAIEQSAHLFLNPDSLLGYGIPDMKIADKILKSSILEKWANNTNWLVYPNPATDYLVLQKSSTASSGMVQLAFYTVDGKLLRREEKPDASKIMVQNLQTLPRGLLILHIVSDDAAEAFKIKISH
jgi:subtilisin family serine protease